MRRAIWLAGVVALSVSWPASTLPAPAAGMPSPRILGWLPGVSRNVSPAATIKVFFNQSVDHASVERAWSLWPGITGRFAWEQTAAIFTPTQSLAADRYFRG